MAASAQIIVLIFFLNFANAVEEFRCFANDGTSSFEEDRQIVCAAGQSACFKVTGRYGHPKNCLDHCPQGDYCFEDGGITCCCCDQSLCNFGSKLNTQRLSLGVSRNMNRLAALCSFGLLILYIAAPSVDAIHCFDENQDEIFACSNAVSSCFYTGNRALKFVTAAGCGDDSDFCLEDGSTNTQCSSPDSLGSVTCCCHQELCNKGFSRL